MLSVAEAIERIRAAFSPLPAERVAVGEAVGRVLALDAIARMDQPPAPVSAMDGYAVRAAEAKLGAELRVIGEAPAGRPFGGRLEPGGAVRIFTGGVVPEGADAVVIQEDVAVCEPTEGGARRIRIHEAPHLGANVRVKGLDFREGEVLIERGRRLKARDLALLAAADLPELLVTRKPRVAIVATGDELFRPGEPRKEGGVAASSMYALQAMVRAWGGDAFDAGILPDRADAFARLPELAAGADLIVTQGGASVGDHDLVQSALKPHGFVVDFWKIAMRPGKPLIFGRLKNTPFIGLPGNPVSAMVCAILFIRPAVAALLGTHDRAPVVKARLASALKANGKREDYLRARLVHRNGILLAEPFAVQDSSMQKVFARADGLIIREVGAPFAAEGTEVDVLLLDECPFLSLAAR